MVYVFVMASTYAVVGIVVGLSGYNVQAFLQNPWVLSAIALLFVILSLSMFGFYELQMPASLQTRLTQWSNKKGGGQVSGVAAMGFVSTLIVGPCVTAPLAGALIYIAKTGDAFIGGAALFSLGLGMGVPLLLIGTSAGKFVPKAGVWMNATKQIFGILMLVMAVYMISRILPTAVSMGLYGILAIMSGIYLGATDSVNRDSTGWHRFGKGAGIVVSVYGLALLLGALANGNSYTAPLKSVMSTLNTSDNGVPVHGFVFQSVKGIDGLQQAVKQASAEGRPVMLDFYADWCISCKEMDAFTFSDVQVKTLLKDVLVLQADVTENDMLDQALLKAFALFGPPGIIFYDSNGNEIPAARLVGFMSAANFKKHLQRWI
jgi:thiol:disulfide interchange protein DsbD